MEQSLHTQEPLCRFEGGVQCYEKVDWCMRHVDFSNGGGDLIGGLKSKGVGCIPPGQGRKEQVREKQYLHTQRSESVESSYKT